MACPWLPEYVAVDLETTGLAADRDALLEVAGVRFIGGSPSGSYTTTLRQEQSLGQRTALMTGLTDADLASGLPVAEALRALKEFAGDLPLVAHNVSLDRDFLARYSAGLQGIEFHTNPWWDSLELAALVFPEMESLALEHVASALGLPAGTRHRAESDAILAGQVFAALFAHIAEHWPPWLIAQLRTVELAGLPFGPLLERFALPAGHASLPPTELPDLVAPKARRPQSARPQRPLHLQRFDTLQAALDAARSDEVRLLYPPSPYPGGFHGPDKVLRAAAREAGLALDSGSACRVDRGHLELLLAGGLAFPGTLQPFEHALLKVWASQPGPLDSSRLSWWVLNNYPALAGLIPLLAASEEAAPATPGLVSWQTAHGAAVASSDGWGLLQPLYWPLHALRALQTLMPVSGLHQDWIWLGGLIRELEAPEWSAWWAGAQGPVTSALEVLEQVLVPQESEDEPRNSTVSRGEDQYWPAPPEPELQPLLQTWYAALESHLPAAHALLAEQGATLPAATARLLLLSLRRWELVRQQLAYMLADWEQTTVLVIRRGMGKSPAWWSLAFFPRLERRLSALLPGDGPIRLYTTVLDGTAWQRVTAAWQAQDPPATFTEHAAPIPRGNAIFLPLLPAGVSELPAKKVWQPWQWGLVKRVVQDGEGRWLIVARNIQDVATLQHRLREPLLRAGWQPLFQRHDGTKGFLMREYGGFEKVIMISTGEILQDLDRFPVPPETIVLLHLPTRPPNELACVALQEQLGLSPDEFREQVLVPLGFLDLHRALRHWQPFCEGRATVYQFDFRYLGHPALRAILNQSFTAEEVLDVQHVGRY